MPSATPSSSSMVLRVYQVLSEDDNEVDNQVTSIVATHTIVLGKGLEANFKLFEDLDVDAAHGTLERTLGLGIWVYSDHSRDGSMLNENHRVHNDAVVVHHGDRLKLGRMEIELNFDREVTEVVQEKKKNLEEKKVESPIRINHESRMSVRNVSRMDQRRASVTSGSVGTMSKLQQAKERLPRIETSGLGYAAVESMKTPPEYTALPISGTQWRRKRNPSDTTTAMTARTLPSPLSEQHGHTHSFHRPYARCVQGLNMPFISIRKHPEVKDSRKCDLPPPLEYSDSPAVSPSSLAARQRYNLSYQLPSSETVPASGLLPEVPPPSISAGVRLSSRRDDLRIQVSKKMAAAAPVGANVFRIDPKALEFQPPASPVAQRDLIKQQKLLQTILQHKFDEEQLLKQQQEEWMRQNLMSVTFDDKELQFSTLRPLQPPTGSEKWSLDTGPNEFVLYPATDLVPSHTLSLGRSQEEHIVKPSPRLPVPTQTSRASSNSIEERPNERKYHGRDGHHNTTDLVLSPSTISKWEDRSCTAAKENELCRSDESILSTATTVIACRRRITSSLSSSCTSSVGLCDFLGYEEDKDTEDMVTSYTTADVHGSADVLRA
ncbi:unnamed protein product [Peronospora belbahrii]|uniref:FHA domain-containing protein n=1 Tax=Peronospora belbahrii TaxID=622444 RepID=A0AAU9LA82_9STRA|nr:unnamed protein product [Peronospora belbahrii]